MAINVRWAVVRVVVAVIIGVGVPVRLAEASGAAAGVKPGAPQGAIVAAAQGAGARAAGARPAITGGQDGRSAWMVAQYRQLQVRKRSVVSTGVIETELRVGRDSVLVTVAPEAVAVARGGRRIVLDSPAAYESLQQLLGGSMAVYATKLLLSELESTSALDAPEMSLLSVAAFVASLVGDVEAPRRLADRFVAKHRGVYRQVRNAGGCWANYSSEVMGAWNDLQSCMEEAQDDPWWWAPVRRLACNGTWLLRSESAWFEYLKCLSPMSAVPH